MIDPSHSRIWTMFLDFDGVLNNEPFLRRQRNHPPLGGSLCFDPVNIAALNRLCRRLPVSSIVVSSSWRLNRQLACLRLLLSNEGFVAPSLVHGVTGTFPDKAEGRADAIAAYVEKLDLQKWFALDDYDLLPFLNPFAVRIPSMKGLTFELVDAMVSTLLETWTVRLTIQPEFLGPASVGTVSVIKLVREHLNIGLAQAKSAIDRAVFSGEPVELSLKSEEASSSLVKALRELEGPAMFHATITKS